MEAQELTPLPDPNLVNETRCRNSRPNFWLCSGNTAWQDGFLIPKLLMEDLINTSTLLPQVLKERDEYRKLLDEASFQRDSYKGLYDSEKESYETLSLEVINISNQRNDLVTDLEKAYKENVKISDKLERSHTTMELWLISGSTAVVFTAVGIIVGIYALD